jgi:hypothetical protein
LNNNGKCAKLRSIPKSKNIQRSRRPDRFSKFYKEIRYLRFQKNNQFHGLKTTTNVAASNYIDVEMAKSQIIEIILKMDRPSKCIKFTSLKWGFVGQSIENKIVKNCYFIILIL